VTPALDLFLSGGGDSDARTRQHAGDKHWEIVIETDHTHSTSLIGEQKASGDIEDLPGFSVLSTASNIHGRMARGGHGLPKVSPGTAMPYPSMPWGRATPETALRPFQG
jgi:hypothetical protein